MERLARLAPLVLLDIVAGSAAYGLYYAVRFEAGLLAAPVLQPAVVLAPALGTGIVWAALLAAFGLYRERHRTRFGLAQAAVLGKAVVAGVLLLFFVLFFDAVQAGEARLTLPVYGAFVFGLVAAGRLAYALAWRSLQRHGVALVPLAVVGEGRRVRYVADWLRAHPELGYAPVVLVAFDLDGARGHVPRVLLATPGQGGGADVVTHEQALRAPADVEGLVRRAVEEQRAREILVLLGPDELPYYFALVRVCHALSVPLRFVANYRPIVGELGEAGPLGHLALPPLLAGGAPAA